MFFSQKTVLVTGGTGSFGQKFAEILCSEYPFFHKLIIFSRDEYKQAEMARKFEAHKAYIKFIIGDVRDKEALKNACKGVDYLIHAAALKQVDTAEANPTEYIKTNVNGTENIVNIADECGVEKVILLSTDKAVNPVGVYGTTKLCAEKVFIAANEHTKTMFSVLRFGNMLGSRGSVMDYLNSRKFQSEIILTDAEMARFGGDADILATQVIYLLQNMAGGEIFIPKLPVFKLTDLALSINPNFKFLFKGIRPGERIHEQLIGSNELYSKIETPSFYLLISDFWKGNMDDLLIKNDGVKLPHDFSYTTESNISNLSNLYLQKLISQL
jgi:FlaA1/EpsC-like NDP-sugar epimerase